MNMSTIAQLQDCGGIFNFDNNTLCKETIDMEKLDTETQTFINDFFLLRDAVDTFKKKYSNIY